MKILNVEEGRRRETAIVIVVEHAGCGRQEARRALEDNKWIVSQALIDIYHSTLDAQHRKSSA